MMNAAEITMWENPETVAVSEFRNRIEHLERKVNCDRHACKGPQEIERWIREAQRVGSELSRTTCKRAKAEDWTRREKAIQRSADAILAAQAKLAKGA